MPRSQVVTVAVVICLFRLDDVAADCNFVLKNAVAVLICLVVVATTMAE